MSDTVQRYPLQWPTGWKRTLTGSRRWAKFGKKTQGTYGLASLTIADATRRVSDELRRLGVADGDWLISSNVRVRLDGLPSSNQGEPADPGAAVYFRLGAERTPRVLACDKWARLADNLAAIAWHIEAIRAVERYGVGTLDQAFAGYAALPANTAANWRDVFGFEASARVTRDQVDERFRVLARQAHPDAGGSHDQMARLSEAKSFALKELGA